MAYDVCCLNYPNCTCAEDWQRTDMRRRVTMYVLFILTAVLLVTLAGLLAGCDPRQGPTPAGTPSVMYTVIRTE